MPLKPSRGSAWAADKGEAGEVGAEGGSSHDVSTARRLHRSAGERILDIAFLRVLVRMRPRRELLDEHAAHR
jgi:hypothetical protein